MLRSPQWQTGGAGSCGCSTRSTQQRADVPKAWLPPSKFRTEIWGVSHRHRPLRREVSVPSNTQPAAHSDAPAAWMGGMDEERRSSPKAPATPDNPSVSLRLTAPFAQGSLGDGGCGLPRRFAPRNDSPDPLSFRGGPTGRRGNPSFLRWTGVRAAVPRAWPPPTKFRAEIWGVGQVVGPYGKPDQPPKPAGAQRSVRARVGEGWAGIGAKAIPKGGPPPRPPRQRLAKRKARKEQLVKFGLCPMTSEGSTAYRVRKFAKGPARALAGAVSIE